MPGFTRRYREGLGLAALGVRGCRIPAEQNEEKNGKNGEVARRSRREVGDDDEDGMVSVSSFSFLHFTSSPISPRCYLLPTLYSRAPLSPSMTSFVPTSMPC